MHHTLRTKIITASTALVLAFGSLSLALVPVVASATFGYGGDPDKVTVCKKTGSRFRPYVKVTVPEFVAERFLADGGVLPDGDGKCPEGINIREYITERRAAIAVRLNSIFDRVFGRLKFGSFLSLGG